jgi:hypothetical protein
LFKIGVVEDTNTIFHLLGNLKVGILMGGNCILYYILRFFVSWILWFLFADKKRWRELFPVGFFAGYIGSVVDNVDFEQGLWSFPGVSLTRTTVLDDLGLNVVFTYLFIQWLPKNQTLIKMVLYIFLWTLLALLIELIHISTGHLKYSHGWNLGWSYFTDWLLLLLFYAYHRIFKFRKLARN